jgi:hypothetical protein
MPRQEERMLMRRLDGRRRCRRRWEATALSAMVAAAVAVVAATAQPAGATLLIQNHTDPAGDPAAFSYHVDLPEGLPPADFQLGDGQEWGFGPFAGQVVAVELPPPGWHVAQIRCVGPDATAFDIDVAAARVTTQHGATDEQVCSFTNRRNAPSLSSSGPSPAPTTYPGIAPAPPTSATRNLPVQRRATVIDVRSRHRGAMARVVLVKRSIVKTQLLWRGRAVGTSRVVRQAGMYDVTVRVRPSTMRQLRRTGRKHVTLTLRMVVVPTEDGSTTVFRSGVIVAL